MRSRTSLEDLFAAGFVPSASLTEFTVGVEMTTNLVANKVAVPELPTPVLLGLGLVFLALAQRRVVLRGLMELLSDLPRVGS